MNDGVLSMTKKLSRIIAVIMLIIAVLFIIVALNNPQAGFPWSNTVTYTIYEIYAAVVAALLVAPFKKTK